MEKEVISNQLVLESAIWDLHIHTCKCTKASGEFKDMSVNDYIDRFKKITDQYKDLKMIAFTDHNIISKEIHDEYIAQNVGIELIPAIELDTYLYEEDFKAKNDKYKHIIFYFDPNTFDYSIHCNLINKRLEENGPEYIYTFLDFLITKLKGVSFLLSPHFMKQNERGIEFDWNDDNINEEITKCIDQQMFCFWETSSVKNINFAVEYLRQFDLNNKISIISFSDSNTFTKFEDYLKNPKQFFNALSNYNGLKMVASDHRRISREKRCILSEEKGKFIGKVVQGENEIYFSKNLNTIIGGRGSGKSLMIDGIALSTKTILSDNNIIKDERKDYIANLNYQIYDMNGNQIVNSDSFKIDYFNQGYVMKLFENGDDFISSSYFKDEFCMIDDFDVSKIKAGIISELLINKATQKATNDNIVSLYSINKIMDESKKSISIARTKKEPNSDYINYDKARA